MWTRIEYMISDFWSSFVVSLIIAAFCLIFLPGSLTASALLSLVWIVLVVFAFIKFKLRAFWFLLGMPLAAYWLWVLYAIGSGCAQNVKNCP